MEVRNVMYILNVPLVIVTARMLWRGDQIAAMDYCYYNYRRTHFCMKEPHFLEAVIPARSN